MKKLFVLSGIFCLVSIGASAQSAPKSQVELEEKKVIEKPSKPVRLEKAIKTPNTVPVQQKKKATKPAQVATKPKKD